MTIGNFRLTYPNYKGWLETVEESDRIKVTIPKEGSVFQSEKGRKEKDITIAGSLKNSGNKGKVLVILRTDIDYPQALGEIKKSGEWVFPECRLGSVDHQIYAVFIDSKDKPLFRSKVINVRLERGK